MSQPSSHLAHWTLQTFLQANFTGPDPAPGKDPKRTVTFYSVDPTTGETKSFVLPGVYNFPTAFEYSCKLDAVVVSVKRYATNGEQNGYIFYKINPETAAPTLLAQTDVRSKMWRAWGEGKSRVCGWKRRVWFNFLPAAARRRQQLCWMVPRHFCQW
jgi:hypothetical protein